MCEFWVAIYNDVVPEDFLNQMKVTKVVAGSQPTTIMSNSVCDAKEWFFIIEFILLTFVERVSRHE